MSCYGCGASFGLFSKEHGCKNCGFAFCGKCLTKKYAIPKLNNEKHKVCNKCYNILTGKINPEEKKRDRSPPEAYKKRIAALQERGEHSKTSHSKNPTITAKGGTKLPTGHSRAEREIAERLQKLKEKPPEQVAKENVSEKEIKERLARLKGENAAIQVTDKKPVYKPPDNRTQQLQIDDLLDEISNEVDMDSRLPNSQTELEGRLANLKGERDQNADKKENDLNRGETKDTKPYIKNITSDDDKKSNEEGGEISAEEINKILEETSKECELEARRALNNLRKDKEIMKRLQEIKSQQKNDVNKQGDGSGTDDPENQPENSDTDNEEQLASDLIQQIVEEDKLDEAAAKDGISTKNSDRKARKTPKQEQGEVDEDELPYCCICTEDATIRCHGCDLDLYCNRCWKESHIDFQMEDHVTSKYIKPKDSNWT